MEIEKIIYETTRELYNVEDKLKIATIFLFCYNLSSITFSELLYCKDKSKFINNLKEEYKYYDVDFEINFNDKNNKNAFDKTLHKVIEKYDDNKFYKAVFEKDPFAMVICDIVNINFDDNKFTKITTEIGKQLKLF